MINESRSQELSEEKFKEMLDNKCKNWSLGNQQIYRGISSGSHPFLYINPKGHDRFKGGQDGINYYGIIMDNAEQWSEFPKRSESVIGTNDTSFTIDFAEWDDDYLNYHIIIPFDNTIWGITPKDDLWFAYDVDELGLRDLAEFNNILNMTIVNIIGVSKINVNTLSDLKISLSQIDYTNKENINKQIDKLRTETLVSELKEFGEDTIINKTLEGLKNSNNSEQALEVIMSSLYSDEFSLQTYGNHGIRFTKQTQECWSNGECIMIRRDYFEKMFGKI